METLIYKKKKKKKKKIISKWICSRIVIVNYVLVLQTELGKPKRRGVMIPEGYTYGRPNDERDGGSSEGKESLCHYENTPM